MEIFDSLTFLQKCPLPDFCDMEQELGKNLGTNEDGILLSAMYSPSDAAHPDEALKAAEADATVYADVLPIIYKPTKVYLLKEKGENQTTLAIFIPIPKTEDGRMAATSVMYAVKAKEEGDVNIALAGWLWTLAERAKDFICYFSETESCNPTNEETSPETDSVEMGDLLNRAKEFELDGVEFTDMDVDFANKLMSKGVSKDEAVAQTLSGIRETLDDGLEEEK